MGLHTVRFMPLFAAKLPKKGLDHIERHLLLESTRESQDSQARSLCYFKGYVNLPCGRMVFDLTDFWESGGCFRKRRTTPSTLIDIVV